MNRTRATIGILAVATALGGMLVAVRARPAPDAGEARRVDGGPALPDAKVVDLTYAFDATTIYWPTDQSFRWERTKWGPAPGGYWYASATYAASEHGGTHIDSPIHFAEGGATVDRIPPEKLIGPAVVIDVSEACARDRDYRLRVADIAAWERAHGPIPAGAIVLMRTGWGRFWPDKVRYLGSATPDDAASLHFPGISQEAARWLAAEREIDGVGTDTASLDAGPSRDFLAHRALNGAGLYGLENVAHLDRLPPTGATLIALPMKIKGGTGAPTRIIAILP
jgi:kynurenine formamidase